jgi:hypothetical protein
VLLDEAESVGSKLGATLAPRRYWPLRDTV